MHTGGDGLFLVSRGEWTRQRQWEDLTSTRHSYSKWKQIPALSTWPHIHGTGWKKSHYQCGMQAGNKDRFLWIKNEERMWRENSQEWMRRKGNTFYSLCPQSCLLRAEHSLRRSRENHENELSVNWLRSIHKEVKTQKTNFYHFSFLFVSFLPFIFFLVLGIEPRALCILRMTAMTELG